LWEDINMSTTNPVKFELRDGYAVFRAGGQVSLEQAVQIIDTALAAARAAGYSKLLVHAADFTGFGPPDLAARYFFIRQWAETVGGKMKVVTVTKPEMIDPEKFGVTVAANFGLTAEVFPTEAEAVAWLLRLP